MAFSKRCNRWTGLFTCIRCNVWWIIMSLMRYLKASKERQIVVGGHRGHQSDIRENTIRNFSQLLGKGIPYIEIDVQLTRDAIPVIFHDERLDTGTSLCGTVRDYPLEELRRSFEINTVEEVLEWAGRTQMGIAFELKLYPVYEEKDRRLIVEELSKAIRKYGFYENCFVFGKDYRTLRYLRSLDKDVKIGIIAPKNRDEAIPLMQELNAFMYLDFLSGLDAELVRSLHNAGYLVDGSVVDTEAELTLAREVKVDMMESNRPEYILSLL